jgi:cell division protein ZapA (FtsZ GTPase activity inhibitor)
MEDKAITVLIAERQYRLTVGVEELDLVQKAAKLIDQKVKEYAQSYAFKDKQDLLAMIVLQFTTALLTEESKPKTIPEDLINRLKDVDKVLTESI